MKSLPLCLSTEAVAVLVIIGLAVWMNPHPRTMGGTYSVSFTSANNSRIPLTGISMNVVRYSISSSPGDTNSPCRPTDTTSTPLG